MSCAAARHLLLQAGAPPGPAQCQGGCTLGARVASHRTRLRKEAQGRQPNRCSSPHDAFVISCSSSRLTARHRAAPAAPASRTAAASWASPQTAEHRRTGSGGGPRYCCLHRSRPSRTVCCECGCKPPEGPGTGQPCSPSPSWWQQPGTGRVRRLGRWLRPHAPACPAGFRGCCCAAARLRGGRGPAPGSCVWCDVVVVVGGGWCGGGGRWCGCGCGVVVGAGVWGAGGRPLFVVRAPRRSAWAVRTAGHGEALTLAACLLLPATKPCPARSRLHRMQVSCRVLGVGQALVLRTHRQGNRPRV